jgi:hypothetical protein
MHVLISYQQRFIYNPTTPLRFFNHTSLPNACLQHPNSLSMAEINLQEIHDLLVTVAHEAGRMMMTATPSQLANDTKKNCTLLPPYLYT